MTKLESCEKWLDGLLPPGCELPREFIMLEADRRGFGETTVARAKAALRIVHTCGSGERRRWHRLKTLNRGV